MQTEYTPPRRALIGHIKDDGSVVQVECAVETHYAKSGDYWVSYTDPEQDNTLISDFAAATELQFLDQAIGAN